MAGQDTEEVSVDEDLVMEAVIAAVETEVAQIIEINGYVMAI